MLFGRVTKPRILIGLLAFSLFKATKKILLSSSKRTATWVLSAETSSCFTGFVGSSLYTLRVFTYSLLDMSINLTTPFTEAVISRFFASTNAPAQSSFSTWR